MTVVPDPPGQSPAPNGPFASAFGPIAANPSRQLRLLRPMPGLAGLATFQLDAAPHLPEPFRLLVATEDPSVALIVLPIADPALVLDAADLAAGAAALEASPAELAVLLVASIVRGAQGIEVFVNRRAPVFVAAARRTALQLVLPNPDYPVRQRLEPGDAV